MTSISSRRHRLRGLRVARLALTALILGLTAWLAGLLWFIDQIPRRIEQPETITDAIVVLTGGAGRLAAGLELLAQGRASKLFVSGVYRGVEVDEILRVSLQSPQELECCVELGHDAVDTRGNAEETRQWMASEGYSSLRLVTASYHIPRSRTEFSRAMPAVRLIAHPVFPPDVHIDEWWRWPGTTALLVGEYSKYLVALLLSVGARTVGP
jgi:uncharacterized SAM-binding protein YcdF (DUF218 family)